MSIKKAFEVLKKAIQSDPSYAWAWHCNIAVSAQDEGMEYNASQRAASRFMKTCFGVETKEPS